MILAQSAAAALQAGPDVPCGVAPGTWMAPLPLGDARGSRSGRPHMSLTGGGVLPPERPVWAKAPGLPWTGAAVLGPPRAGGRAGCLARSDRPRLRVLKPALSTAQKRLRVAGPGPCAGPSWAPVPAQGGRRCRFHGVTGSFLLPLGLKQNRARRMVSIMAGSENKVLSQTRTFLFKATASGDSVGFTGREPPGCAAQHLSLSLRPPADLRWG